MKGISFQNGVEFRLNISGESWPQGSELSLQLDAIEKNPGALAKLKPRFVLAEGLDKKVKAKSPDAFKVLWEEPMSALSISHKVQLQTNARITDSKGSLYLLYGNSTELSQLGMLKLNVIPHALLMDFSESLNTHFRFVTKSISHGKKDDVHFLYSPPSSKDWASLTELEWIAQFVGEDLECDFLFYRSEIDATKPGTKAVSVTKKFARKWKTADLVHSFNERLNKDLAEAEIQKVIDEYRGQNWLA